MPKAYLRIASKVGAALRGKLRQVEREPLPEELARLLQKLDERLEGATGSGETASERGESPCLSARANGLVGKSKPPS